MRLKARVFWIIFGIALLAGMISFVPDYKEYCSVNPDTHEKECGTYHSALVVLIEVSKALDRAGGALTALATIFIGVFTLALWRSTDKLWLSAREQAIDMKASIAVSRASAGHAEASVKTAMDNIEIAKRTAEKQLRAYIGVVDFKMICPNADIEQPAIPNLDSDNRWIRDVINMTVVNGGQTPAYQTRAHINWTWTQFGHALPQEFHYPEQETGFVIDEMTGAKTGPIVSRLNIMPDKTQTFTFQIDVENVRKSRRKEIFLWVYGRVDYIDVFDIERHTDFCCLYLPDRDGSGESFTTYHEHNNSY